MLFVTGLLTGVLFALMGITAFGISEMHKDEKRIEKLKYEEGKEHGQRNQASHERHEKSSERRKESS